MQSGNSQMVRKRKILGCLGAAALALVTGCGADYGLAVSTYPYQYPYDWYPGPSYGYYGYRHYRVAPGYSYRAPPRYYAHRPIPVPPRYLARRPVVPPPP